MFGRTKTKSIALFDQPKGILGYKVIVQKPIAIGAYDIMADKILYNIPDLGGEVEVNNDSVSIRVFRDGIWFDSEFKNLIQSIRFLEDLEKDQYLRISATRVNNIWLEGNVKGENQREETNWKTHVISLS